MKVRKGLKAKATQPHKDRTKYDRKIDDPEYREWHEQAQRDLRKIAGRKDS